LKELILSRHELIKDLYPLTLDNTYASSILFPFANRTKMEAMNLIAKYQLDINEKRIEQCTPWAYLQ
jgi:aldose 1-epimerase